MSRFRCRHCGMEYQWTPELAGEEFVCEACGKTQRVPRGRRPKTAGKPVLSPDLGPRNRSRRDRSDSKSASPLVIAAFVAVPIALIAMGLLVVVSLSSQGETLADAEEAVAAEEQGPEDGEISTERRGTDEEPVATEPKAKKNDLVPDNAEALTAAYVAFPMLGLKVRPPKGFERFSEEPYNGFVGRNPRVFVSLRTDPVPIEHFIDGPLTEANRFRVDVKEVRKIYLDRHRAIYAEFVAHTPKGQQYAYMVTVDDGFEQCLSVEASCPNGQERRYANLLKSVALSIRPLVAGEEGDDSWAGATEVGESESDAENSEAEARLPEPKIAAKKGEPSTFEFVFDDPMEEKVRDRAEPTDPAVLRPKPTGDRLLGQSETLPFRMRETDRLKLAPGPPERLVFTEDGQRPGDPAAPVMFATADPCEIPSNRRRAESFERLKRTEGVHFTQHVTFHPTRIDGITGFRVAGSAVDGETQTPLTIFQICLFDGKRCYLMRGRVGTDRKIEFLPEFERLAETFRTGRR